MKFISNSNDLSKFLEKSIKKNIKIKSISTDSRTLKKDSLFIAIKGNFFDGNDYIEEAFKRGSCLAITDNKKFKHSKNKKVIYVNSSLLALKKITKNIIKQYEGNIIGITGSNGKTTTTMIIANSLKSSSSTLKNFNNEIGMPLSILNANPKSKNLVIEMGAAKPKDIHYLSSILKPSVGVITNIGNSHLENLKNTEGVLNVKSELVSNIKHNGFLVVPNENAKHLKFWRNIRNDIHIRTFGLKSNADFYSRNIVMKSNKTEFEICSKKYNLTIPISTTLLGDHNIKNILAAFAASYCINNTEEAFLNGIKRLSVNNMRQKQSKWIRGSLLIDDTYNANPESVKKSIDLTKNFKTKRTIFILGDMKELGRYRKKLHKEVGAYAKKQKVDLFVGFGELTRFSVDAFGKNGFFFSDKEQLHKFLVNNIQRNDLVILKGSRGMQMEQFINTQRGDS
jgi:UDP-N-acetylmuramoyl-tripeptide--D-alanyl-D-alanine ligase